MTCGESWTKYEKAAIQNRISRDTFSKRLKLGWSPECAATKTIRKSNKNKIFALYKGEQNITDGTLEEISKCAGVSIKVLRWMNSPSAHERIGNTGMCLVEIVEEDDYSCLN